MKVVANALNVGTEKAYSKYYSYQNDSTDIIQANTNKFNKRRISFYGIYL